MRYICRTAVFLVLVSVSIFAQTRNDQVPLKYWQAPLYWQPNQTESLAAAATGKSNLTIDATIPANSLVFVGTTPCRVVDTRTTAGYPPPFGPPSLVGGATRTLPIPTSTTCSIPSIAQAYSFNVTVVPTGFLDYMTIWPTGQAMPVVSTLNSYLGAVVANAAIVPAGTNGSINVFASQNTELIIDVNGYYAPQSGITLAQGAAGAPSLSFSGDPGTGVFSSGAGNLNLATAGTSRVNVASDGNVGIGTSTTPHRLNLDGGPTWTTAGWTGSMSLPNGGAIGWSNSGGFPRFGIGHTNGGMFFFNTQSDPGTTTNAPNYVMTLSDGNNVGIGNTDPGNKLVVDTGSAPPESGITVQGRSTTLGDIGLQISNTGTGGVNWLIDSTANASNYGGGKLAITPRGQALPNIVFTVNNKVGIGTLNPNANARLHVEANGNINGIYSHNIGEGTAGISADNTTGMGVIGSSQSGFGVFGSSGNSDGVHGSSALGVGVFGINDSGNAGVAGVSTSTGPGLVARSGSGNLVEGYGSIGGSSRAFHIDHNGTYFAGSDFAEALHASGKKTAYERGDVLVLSTTALGTVEKSAEAYDGRVAGVYSTRPGVVGADKDGATRVDADDLPVAIVGIVPTKVSTENGTIRIGDLLTTSATPGHAMRCDDRLKCLGAVLGKAMEPLSDSTGMIKVLVNLR